MKMTRNHKRRLTTAFKRGVKTLDALIPDWREKINWDRFYFANPSTCIAGQLGLKDADEYGFNVYDDICFDGTWQHTQLAFDFLENLWKSEKPS